MTSIELKIKSVSYRSRERALNMQDPVEQKLGMSLRASSTVVTLATQVNFITLEGEDFQIRNKRLKTAVSRFGSSNLYPACLGVDLVYLPKEPNEELTDQEQLAQALTALTKLKTRQEQ